MWWFWLCREKQFIWRTLHEKQMAYFHPSAELISFIKGQRWNKKKCPKHHCRCSAVTLLFFLFLCLRWSPCLCDFVIGLSFFLYYFGDHSHVCVPAFWLPPFVLVSPLLRSDWVHLAQSTFCLRAVSQLTELSTTSSPCLVRMFPLTNFIFLVFWENWISSVSLQPNKRARAKCWLPTSLELYKFCFCFIWISLHVCIF